MRSFESSAARTSGQFQAGRHAGPHGAPARRVVPPGRPGLLAAAALLVIALILAYEVKPARAQLLPAPPGQPTTGLGANGPCTKSSVTRPNPAASGQYIVVYSPGGSAASPAVGGTCADALRPVVVVVHGLGAGLDVQTFGGESILYADLITHLVSLGNVVVFATYNTDGNDVIGSYRNEDAALATAATMAPRGDFSRLGIVGHSMGGGATPYLAQQATARGWGSRSLWLVPIAPWFVHGVGTGPITVPARTRVVVIGYDNDTYVDNRIGIDLYRSLSVPASQKQHVTVRSQTRWLTTLNAQHTAPNSLIAPNDAIKYYGLYRTIDALETCSLLGTNCNADLTAMGSWSDGQPVTPAISTDTPTDSGPTATSAALLGLEGECDVPANPRAATCGT
jgi:hypothetical protein